MRKFMAALFLLSMVSGAASTTIDSERLVIDLENKRAEATVEVDELTSSNFIYSTGMDVRDVAASDGSEVKCSTESRTLGDEIICQTDRKENFTMELTFGFQGLTDTGNQRTFSYTHPFYRPTENFNLKVKLSQGTVLAEDQNGSPDIFPSTGEPGSDGRRIFVKWSDRPSLGTLDFRIRYENSQNSLDPFPVIGGAVIILVLSISLFYYWRWMNREKLESVYSELSNDEKKIMEMLRDNDGEMLQKEVVENSDYSKAKISGLVSGLVEEGFIEKEKEGRSNKLTIPKKFNY